jgi:anhydro-N-acetylmuramic acid kinase
MSRARLILGLMSGTSHDGVDAALVRVRGSGPELLHHLHLPFSPSLRAMISAAPGGGVPELCRLNFELGDVFARAALKCAEESGVPLSSIDAIASHGQTICHIPPEGGKRGSTLQIGESAVIAEKTGVPVVSDFRVADMAAGGHGAPLVPYADYLLFRGRKTRAVQNIGGIANVTVVTPEPGGLLAFDTGPGNCMMDAAARAVFGKPFDRGGKIARKGKPDDALLDDLMGLPYFSKKPPKSTGTDVFPLGLINRMLKGKRIMPEDLLATLAHFTARSIRDAYERFVYPRHRVSEVIVSGGGTRNVYLMELLRDGLGPLPVKAVEEYGIPAGAKEAMSFAALANETLSGNPSNVPSATGALRGVVLGKITPPTPNQKYNR